MILRIARCRRGRILELVRGFIGLVASVALALVTAPVAHAHTESRAPAGNINTSSIPVAMTREYDGRDLTIRKNLFE